MEFAMMDKLAHKAAQMGVKVINGYYFPTAKNGMVKDFYALQGFTKVSEDDEGNTKWVLDISSGYEDKNRVIKVD